MPRRRALSDAKLAVLTKARAQAKESLKAKSLKAKSLVLELPHELLIKILGQADVGSAAALLSSCSGMMTEGGGVREYCGARRSDAQQTYSVWRAWRAYARRKRDAKRVGGALLKSNPLLGLVGCAFQYSVDRGHDWSVVLGRVDAYCITSSVVEVSAAGQPTRIIGGNQLWSEACVCGVQGLPEALSCHTRWYCRPVLRKRLSPTYVLDGAFRTASGVGTEAQLNLVACNLRHK